MSWLRLLQLRLLKKAADELAKKAAEAAATAAAAA